MTETNPISRLLGSSKALVTMTVTALLFVGVFLGKVPWSEVKGFLTVLLPVWLGAQGLEDAAKHVAKPSTEAVTKAATEAAKEEVKRSLPPPAAPAEGP